MENPCIFNGKFNCDDKSDLTKAGPVRIKTVIGFSKEYNDNIHIELEEKLGENPELTIDCHRCCVSTYTSQQHLKRHKKRESSSSASASQPIKKRRSSIPSFRFQDQCLFCGDACDLSKDKKHPDRWRKAVLCRTAGEKAFKESILVVCGKRNDEIANQVRVRVEGAISDLHAADARYHVDCMTTFMSPKSINAAQNASKEVDETDLAFNQVIDEMMNDRSRLWNTIELFHKYQLFGGKTLLRRTFLMKIQDQLDDVVVLTSPGLASLVVFRNSASSALHLASDSDTEDGQQEYVIIRKLAKVIVDEMKQIAYDKSRYDIRITKEDMATSVSQTLMNLLAAITENLHNTLPALLIGNIVTSVFSNKPTSLQISLGNLIRDSKSLLNKLFQFRVTCSYDEILRFKKSAALAATKSTTLTGIKDGRMGLIQVVADNFDADISSQNGKQSTHSLAILITQPMSETNDDTNDNTITRISKTKMSQAIDFDIPVHRYQGPKIVPMPKEEAVKTVLPLKVLCSCIIAERRAKELDVSFLKDVTTNEGCPEYNGYNTSVTRYQGVSMQPKTTAAYLPLIDMTPSNPDTIITALHEAKRLTKERGQKNAIFTSDQQLYKIAVEVKWAYPKEFSDVIIRLGGMHMLMSFVGAVGTLMKGTGLSEVMESTFAGVTKMLSGKKFPQNVRAMRLVVEELLRGIMSDGNKVTTMEELLERLDQAACASKTSKLWVDCFIKTVFIMMLYVRAEREGDWPLHLVAVKQMLPYFFASAHVNYARYGLYYLRSMESLDREELAKFMKGEHVMHHVPGLWNGIWSDMFIETTFMRYGHGPGGIIGITLKPETLKTWALGLHICCRLEQDIAEVVGSEKERRQETHKEETKARIASDSSDRASIREKLKLIIDPLDPASHPPTIVNVVTGQVSDETVNVQDAVTIGTALMEEFERSWPEGFRNTIKKKVKTVADSTKKSIKVGSKHVYDTTVIYSRVIGIQASSRDIDIQKVLSHELSPVPTSMFHDSGAMRLCTGKSDLKKRLAKEVSSRFSTSDVVAVVLDGSAVLWVVHWPAKGTIADYVNNFKEYLSKKLLEVDVYLIFDRYREYSTKSVTRDARACEASRVYQLTENTSLPSQKAVLTVSANKKQLMSIICQSIINDKSFHLKHTISNKLVITGSEDAPTEIYKGVVITRQDVATSHEEADNIIVQQAIMCAKDQRGHTVAVIADDTDVFILLMYHYWRERLTCPMIMGSPIQQRSLIDIKATVQAHLAIIPGLPAAHALSGCDTVPTYFGIGKGSVLKNLVAEPSSLSQLGCLDASLPEVIDQATNFIGSCYSSRLSEKTMSDFRYKIWAAKFGNAASSIPKIQSLPPTSEAFIENVKRAHLQTCIWKAALALDPPAVDPTEHGYTRHEPSKSLLPTTVPDGVSLAPDEIMALIKCNCDDTAPCRNMRCGCSRSKLPCTLFCKCNGGIECHNELTKTVSVPSEDAD